MEFLFECSATRYLKSERSEHEKRNSPSLSKHVLFCLFYKYLTNKKKPTSFTFLTENAFPFIHGAK